jgi:hypothetical protein
MTRNKKGYCPTRYFEPKFTPGQADEYLQMVNAKGKLGKQKYRSLYHLPLGLMPHNKP